MSETSRRNILVQIAGTAAVLGTVSEAEAQHVHNETAAAKPAAAGTYKAKAFNAAEEKNLRVLLELACPGAASKGGAFEFIDLLSSNNAELKAIFTGGLAWTDRECEKRFGNPNGFAALKADEQTKLLDLIAYRESFAQDSTLGPGIKFFEWARRMAVDAYYTSPAGIRELGYKGNKGMADFKVPQASMDHAIKGMTE